VTIDALARPLLQPRRPTLSFVFFTMLTLTGASLAASNDRNDLEYLIFRFAALPNQLPSPANPHARLLALAEISGSSVPVGRGHSLLSDSGLLVAAKKRLVQSPRYRVVLHAQAQRAEAGNFAPVRFRVKSADGGTGADIRVYFQLRGASTKRLSASIVYAPAHSRSMVKNDTTGQQNGPTWVIRDARRITIGEVNYVDHPQFGVLVVATPPD